MGRLRLGRPQAATDAPAHTPGVKQGNSVGNYERQEGHRPDGSSTAARSTGINASNEDPIDPRMPNLSPA